MVERFNKTLKSMLRKLVEGEGKNWDVFRPYLLFAYREVPQSSTGFSPFELYYTDGRCVDRWTCCVKHGWWERRAKRAP